jgi:hypothetical protein
VLQVKQHPRCGARIARVHQHGATLQQVAVALQGEVDDGVEKRMAGADEGGERLPLGRQQGLLEGDALVARQHRFADADEPVAVAHRGGHMADLVAAGLTLFGGAAESFECLMEEGLDVVRLQAAGVGALHVLADAPDPAGVHGVMGEDALIDQVLQVPPVERGVEHRGQEGFDLGPFAVADRFDQQFAQ